MKEEYRRRVNLLVEILPYALNDERMALKGGTAINLFHRNFPRLSVDIDLCYLPLEDRDTSYKNIYQVLAEIKKSLESKLDLKVSVSHPLNGKSEAKLVAKKEDIEVKIEPNYVLRGSLFPAEVKAMAPLAVKEFEKSVKVKCLNIADTYGGKICAALDRQHPRDLFDIKFLLESEGITADIKDSFIFYLLSHSRPINEILNPNFQDISHLYHDEFLDMTQTKTNIEELINSRANLLEAINKSLTNKDKEFLLSFVANTPDWKLVRDAKIKNYPSVKWKLHNQEKMSEKKRIEYVDKVKKLFGGI